VVSKAWNRKRLKMLELVLAIAIILGVPWLVIRCIG